MNKRQFKKKYPFSFYYYDFTNNYFDGKQMPKIGLRQFVRNCNKHRGVNDLLDERLWKK